MKIAHCTSEDIGLKAKNDDGKATIAIVDKYLFSFAKPQLEGKNSFLQSAAKCLRCGRPLGGAIGSFQWGIVHGEGTCSNCGWPARAKHYIKDDEGPIFDRALDMILQYHPDFVQKETKKS